MPREAQPELQLRIIVDHPVPDVLLRLQRGKNELHEPTSTSPAQVIFDFSVRVGPPRLGGAPNFLGPFTQGPPDARFVYVNVGKRAGQRDTTWDRRAKVPLTGITATQVKAVLASPRSRLEAHMPGRGANGEPTCATVRLVPGAWRLARG